MPKAFAPKAPAESGEREQFRLSDHVGTTLAITVQSVEEVETKFGIKDAIKADVTIVDGLMAGMDFGDVLLFQSAVVDSLRDSVGDSEPIVARVGEKVSKNGNTFLRLEAPTADAWSKAEALFVTEPTTTGEPLPF